ncbi:MAG: gliding motility lipoprotein GldB [Flavobacteriaceae bacterium]
MRYYFLFFLVAFFLISCEKDSKNKVDVSMVSVDYEVQRFDIDFYTSAPSELKEVKKKYPFLFPKETPDSVWIGKIKNVDEQELFRETQKVYQDFSKTEKELSMLFQHVKYYNESFKEPDVVTVLSNIDYDYRIVYSNSFVFISLDVYLGKNHAFYGDYPDYIKENNVQERIVVDLANKMIENQVSVSLDRTFLSKMITAGKKLYLLDLYVPFKSDQSKIGYSKEKYEWALANEDQIWRYFIENSLLYSTDTKLNQRFLETAPFSKFYLSEDNKSPGRIGEWIGWQIVRSFMQKNDVSLQSLLSMSGEEIFTKSNYKPKK